MNFADILDKWEQMEKKRASKTSAAPSERAAAGKAAAVERAPEMRANPMDVWLNRHGIEDKDSARVSLSKTDVLRSKAEERRRLRKMKPEAVIDLHGLTCDDAEAALDAFFTDCRRQGVRKILIVHGKGLHSEGSPVLASLVRSYIERNPRAGESGVASREEGGNGALWVILKQD